LSTAPVDSSDTREMEVKSLRTESLIYTPIHLQWYGVASRVRARVCVCVPRKFDLKNNARGHLSNSGQVSYFVRSPATAARTISQPLARYAPDALHSPVLAYARDEKSTLVPLHATILTSTTAQHLRTLIYRKTLICM